MYFPYIMLINTALKNYIENLKPSEAYNFLKRNYTSDRFMLESDEAIRPLSKHEIALLNDDYYTIGDLNKWLKWVNKNIILELGSQTQQTIFVRLRIAVNMLDKLHLVKDDRISIMIMLTANVRAELGKIVAEDLPF